MISGLTAGGGFGVLLDRSLRGETHLLWLAVFTLPGVVAILTVLFASDIRLGQSLSAADRRGDRVRAAAAAALGKVGGAETVSTLVDALRDRSSKVRAAADESIPAVLGRIDPRNAGSFPTELVPGLCRLLVPSNRKLHLPAIHVLAAVGDRRAIRPLAVAASASQSSEIRQAAHDAIAAIRRRAERTFDRDWLLRPAHPPSVEDRHLRPAELGLQSAGYREDVLPPESSCEDSPAYSRF